MVERPGPAKGRQARRNYSQDRCSTLNKTYKSESLKII